MGGSSPKHTTTTSTMQPPGWAKPYYIDFLNQSQEVANQPYTPFGGDTVAGFTPDQILAQNMTRDQVMKGTPGLTNANMFINRTLSGANMPSFGENLYSDALAGIGPNQYAGQNPYLDDLIRQSTEDIGREFGKSSAGVNAQFGAGGAFGGSAHREALADQNRVLGERLGRTVTGLRSDDYNRQVGLAESDINRRFGASAADIGRDDSLRQQGINNQFTALSALPGLTNLGFAGAERLAGIGDAQQQQKQRELDALYAEFLREQGYDEAQLGVMGNALNVIGGNFQTGSSRGPNPNQSSPIGGALGGAAAGSSFGPWGALIGGGIGLLGSL